MSNEINMALDAKSDQLNADDLIGGPITVTIVGIRGIPGEQPVRIDLAECKPFMPCLTVRRLLVEVWGQPGKVNYEGRRMTLYRDSSVTYGGMEVGGIRVSHVSHIDKPHAVVLASSQKKKARITVEPLPTAETPPAAKTWSDWFTAAGITADQLKAWLDAVGMPPLSAMDEETRGEVFANPRKYGDLVRGAK